MPNNVRVRRVLDKIYYICLTHGLDFYTPEAYNLHAGLEHRNKKRMDMIRFKDK